MVAALRAVAGRLLATAWPAGGSTGVRRHRCADWIPPIPLQTHDGGIGRFHVPWGFRLDPLSGMMLLVVTGIGTLIHVYSTAYMADEPRGGVARFFCYLNLFCFFMLMLVLGSNFLVMFVGWEGVGLCSYLLIGYWYEKKSAADAGKKAFITNRIGDWGFILGVFLIFFTFGTLDFRAVQDAAARYADRVRAIRRAVGHLPAAVRRRDGKERADPAVSSGCRTRWKGRRRCPPSSMRRRW